MLSPTFQSILEKSISLLWKKGSYYKKTVEIAKIKTKNFQRKALLLFFKKP